ncbi:MAG: Txe/YoeB family addiction module toxin [Bryobacterales bacterium]|nr:Txe/YoeB family addiction module toxin [Bryobacterales bacterium]
MGSRFHTEFLDDLYYWIKTDRRIALKIFDLVESILKEPFAGIGKPEPLKHELAGAWSRRVSAEHRLVYRVGEGRIDMLTARYHY